MTEGKCDKCGAPTANRGNLFQCGSGMTDYSSKGAKLVKTTTSATETRHCVLCDSCINEYAESLKKGNGNYAAPIAGMIISGLILGLFSMMGGLIRVICLLAIAAFWISAIREILNIRKEALAKSEAAKAANPQMVKQMYERDAEMAFLKRFNTMVAPVESVPEMTNRNKGE